MIEYFITQRYTCDWCKGTGLNLSMLGIEGQEAVEANAKLIPIDFTDTHKQSISDFTCTKCGGSRFVDTKLDADKWFMEKIETLRFNGITGESGGNDAYLGNPHWKKRETE